MQFGLQQVQLTQWQDGRCRTIKRKARCMFVMREFIPKRIHQTHTGSWSLVNWDMMRYYIRGSCILMRWPDGLDIGNGLGQVQRIRCDTLQEVFLYVKFNMLQRVVTHVIAGWSKNHFSLQSKHWQSVSCNINVKEIKTTQYNVTGGSDRARKEQENQEIRQHWVN